MLGIAKVRGGRWEYYLRTAAGIAPDGGLVEPAGRFIGGGAEALGITDRDVDRSSLGFLLGGVDPLSGEVLDPHHHRVRVAAIDCMFAAPKSVSVVHALSSPDVVAEIQQAHDASVQGALGYLEHEAMRVRRRSGGEDRVIPAEGVSAAAFVHRTSRAPDPHLHTHVLVANLASDGEGRWSALDARPIFSHARTAGALYRAQLRHELVQRLDVSWRWRDDGFADLTGLRPEVLRAFSRRRQMIEKNLDELAKQSGRARGPVAVMGRPEKDLSVPYEVLVDQWREQAYELGLSLGRMRVVVGPRRGTPSKAPDLPSRVVQREVTSAPFSKSELMRQRSEQLVEGQSVAMIMARVDTEIRDGLASGALVLDVARARGHVTEEIYVTREHMVIEARIAEVLRSSSHGEPFEHRMYTGTMARIVETPGSPWSVPAQLAAHVHEAQRSGDDILLLAPSPRRAAQLEAVTGSSAWVVQAGASVPGHVTGLVVVADADLWDVATLAALVERPPPDASLLFVPSGTGGGRRTLREALAYQAKARDLPAQDPISKDARAQQSPCAMPSARSIEWRATPTANTSVCLVATVQELPLALIDAARVHEEAKGSALIVLGDHALATSMARLLAEVADPMEHRVLAVHSRDLDAARDKMPHAGLVVLGGSAMLTKAARLDTSRKRTHVGIAAPQVDPGSQERWAQRLQSDRWIPRDLSRSRTVGHDRERLVLDHRHVGRDIGR